MATKLLGPKFMRSMKNVFDAFHGSHENLSDVASLILGGVLIVQQLYAKAVNLVKFTGFKDRAIYVTYSLTYHKYSLKVVVRFVRVSYIFLGIHELTKITPGLLRFQISIIYLALAYIKQ